MGGDDGEHGGDTFGRLAGIATSGELSGLLPGAGHLRAERVIDRDPAIAALNAAPQADAVFVAHTGLDAIATLGDVRLALPEHNVVRLHWHRVTADAIPAADGDKAEMLYQAWEAIDAWIDTQQLR